ncbi:MAG: hypothetical protein ABJN14_03065 [Paracoccaceae bacterium]
MKPLNPPGTMPHFVLPDAVYEKYSGLIDHVTQGEFNQRAMYNVVFLYTDPNLSKRAGTVLFGTDLDGLIAAYSNVMNDIAQDTDPDNQLKKFRGAHAYFREALFTNKPPGVTDPCASKNPLPEIDAPAEPKTSSWWKRVFRPN